MPSDDVGNIREVYYSLISQRQFLEEQNWCHEEQTEQETFCTLINTSPREKNETKNVDMTWIDNKMAYDMAPQSWLIDCLQK